MPTCKNCKRSIEQINGTYCTLYRMIVEYRKTPCTDYAPV